MEVRDGLVSYTLESNSCYKVWDRNAKDFLPAQQVGDIPRALLETMNRTKPHICYFP